MNSQHSFLLGLMDGRLVVSSSNLTAQQLRIPTFVYVLNGLELLPLIFTLFFAPLAAIVFVRRPLCHRNLFLIIIGSAGMFVIMQLTRLFIVINGFVDPQKVLGELSLFHHVAPACYFEVLRLFSGFVAICNVMVIITERLIATIQIRNYEQNSHTLIVLLVLFGASICGVFGVNMMYKSYRSLMHATGLVALMILYVAVTFHICEVMLSRQIRNSNGVQNGGYTLSQRYQMRENIRLIKLLRRTMIAFAFCTSSMAMCFVLFVYFLDDPFGNGVYLLRGSINLLIHTSSNVLVVGAITGTHVWRQDLKSRLRFFVYGSRQVLHLRNALVRPSVTKVTYLRDVDGHQLNFNPRDEGRLYFEQLANAWM